MTHEAATELENDAWYYKRWMFTRGVPGVLTLRAGTVSFTTGNPRGGARNKYEKPTDAREVLVDVALSDLDTISYNWVVGGLALHQGARRHLISFTAPRTGGHSTDARSAVTGLLALRQWRTLLAAREVKGTPDQRG